MSARFIIAIASTSKTATTILIHRPTISSYVPLTFRTKRHFSSRPKNNSINDSSININQPKNAHEKRKILSDIAPRDVAPENDRFHDIGQSFSGRTINSIRLQMLDIFNEFFSNQQIRDLAKSQLIDDNLFTKAFISFRRYCYKSESLPPELHIKICDILDKRAHVSDLFPFFLSHSREAFPHLECQEELKKISDLGLPHTWYPEARSKVRKVIFHAGPTNSGKTYHAMRRFLESKSGIYCGPLKLLATEIYSKANQNEVPCDLITGEDRKMANPNQTKSSHVSCTVEMCQVNEHVEVVIIDEIQMLRDPQRGWAWTRALLGVPADEVHLCGEEAALDLVKWMLMQTGDIFEVQRYKRLTPLVIEDKPLDDLKNVRPGDCIVCFRKDDVYKLSMQLENLGYPAAVIYGTLPPGAKITQCKKFNEDDDECKYMVATDAIGMGLNLSIQRIIFYTMMKVAQDNKGNKWQEYISTSQCLQIAGRAGRFKKGNEKGYVTTFRAEDMNQLREIMSRGVPPITQAGLHPTADQIELFAYHLPHLNLADLIDLFIDLCEYDANGYFICDMESFKSLANLIQHIDIPLRSRFLFCSSPINTKLNFVTTMFTKLVRQYSLNEPVTASWICRQISWPCKPPKNIEQLTQLESVFDVLELYLWLSYRFPEIFCQPDEVRDIQKKLDEIIFSAVSSIIRILNPTKVRQARIKK